MIEKFGIDWYISLPTDENWGQFNIYFYKCFIYHFLIYKCTGVYGYTCKSFITLTCCQQRPAAASKIFRKQVCSVVQTKLNDFSSFLPRSNNGLTRFPLLIFRLITILNLRYAYRTFGYAQPKNSIRIKLLVLTIEV